MDNLPCYNFKRGKHDIRIYSLQKKWWYYLVLALSILCSFLLLDYYEIYTYDDV